MKVLVVVDMQKDFIDGPLGNAECMNAVAPVTKLISDGVYDKIFVTYDTHQENYMSTNEGKHLPVPHCIKGTDGYELNPEVKAALANKSGAEIRYIEKPTFGSLDLAMIMKNEVPNTADTQIDFCGVCTGICVISNVMLTKAAVPETDIRVFANACACVTPDTHKTALEAMKLCHIEIVE